MMNGRGKSDSPIVPGKPPNKAEASAAEVVEGRGLAKGNLREQNAPRTQSRTKRVECARAGTSSREQGRAARVFPNRSCVMASLPKAGAGCVSSARPDLWRGPWATMVPTPTIVHGEI